MICVVDYGLGNIGSILNMLKRLNIPAVSSRDSEVVKNSSHLILPGVGTFDNGMRNLMDQNLIELLNEEVLEKKKPVLGICLGAQLMLESSQEGTNKGLGWIDGECLRFDNSLNIKVPHMGWNSLNEIRINTLFQNMPYYPPRFYFVHSFYFKLSNDNEIASTTVYGEEFVSSFRRDNIYGVQFHPEKSHKFGMQVLLNFHNNL